MPPSLLPYSISFSRYLHYNPRFFLSLRDHFLHIIMFMLNLRDYYLKHFGKTKTKQHLTTNDIPTTGINMFNTQRHEYIKSRDYYGFKLLICFLTFLGILDPITGLV